MPQSISVITRDRIEAQKAQTLPEALRYTPGVLAQPWVSTRVSTSSRCAASRSPPSAATATACACRRWA
ncbi:TonB-dependent receptor plug domain-containing protein [Chelatococcus daeguensis]|uniref:TonB-dependent receptor plug domain-containing protein n=1 Tax=Chelatococcus daeguensis TaxID=444444 RepID=UPI0016488473